MKAENKVFAVKFLNYEIKSLSLHPTNIWIEKTVQNNFKSKTTQQTTMKTFIYSCFWVLCGGLVLTSCDDDDSIESEHETFTDHVRLDSICEQMSDGMYNKEFYSYNDRGLVDTIFVNPHYTINVAWRAVPSKKIFTYDAHDSLVSVVKCAKITDAGYVLQDKIEMSRDAMGRKTSECHYVFDENTGEWVVNDPSYEYSYDASGNLTTTICRYNSYVIERAEKYEFVYDARGNRTKNTYYIGSNDVWHEQSSYKYTYDAKNRLTLSDYANFDIRKKTVFNYDSKGNLISKVESTLEIENNQWKDSYKEVFVYNESGRMVSMTEYEHSNDAWMEVIKQTYSYDDKIHRTLTSTYHFMNGGWTKVSDKYYYYSAI